MKGVPSKVVVLDDESFVRESLQMILKREFPEARVITFGGSEEALKELLDADPDLFTTDLMHPGISSTSILRVLAQKNVTYPIFVITSWSEVQAASIIAEFGAKLNLTMVQKPFSPQEFWNLLRRHFPAP